MAISNFVPEVWSSALLQNLRANLVYGQAGVINRNYEGDISQAGDTVHITAFSDPAVRSYTKNTNITYDLLTDDTRALIIDQQKYFAFTVDDIDRRQALPGFVDETTTGASYNLSSAADTYLSGLMKAAVTAGNTATAVTAPTASNAYTTLVGLRTILNKSNTPAQGRWVIVPPEFYALLLQDDRFVRADASGTTAGLRNGISGRAAGFDVMESNTVPFTGDVFSVIAGHPMATTYAEQIVKVESLRLENQFGDGVRGLHVYGAKVVRPAQLAKVNVTFDGAGSSSSSSS